MISIEFSVCYDCMEIISFGFSELLDHEHIEHINRCLELERNLNGGSWHISEIEDEFSWNQCEVCNSRLGGSRWTAVLLTKGG